MGVVEFEDQQIMSVIINEVEVIASPPTGEAVSTANSANPQPSGPTPQDLYWAMRKLIERRVRLQAR